MTSAHLRLIEEHKPVKKKEIKVIGKKYNNLKIVSLHKDSKIPLLRKFNVKCSDCYKESIKTLYTITKSKNGCTCHKLKKIWLDKVEYQGVERTLIQWVTVLGLDRLRILRRYEVLKYRAYEDIFMSSRDAEIKRIEQTEIEAIIKIKARTLKSLEKLKAKK